MSHKILLPSLFSSLIEVTITQPLDVAKTYRQTKIKLTYNLSTLYSGFIPRALGNIPSRTTFLFTQDLLKADFDPNKLKNKLLIPGISGFAQTLIDTPIENLKMKGIFKLTYYKFYSGFGPHVIRNIIFMLPVFNLKEYAKKKYDSIMVQAIYGASGGIIGSYISHPFDTIKTLIQTNNKNDIKKLKFRDYFRGANIRASMAFINMTISLTVFEFMKEILFV